ncbi:MAG TPA: carboxypeptidase-like regulatory domain-containing protein [Pyrinomonadaceae bacterium]|nr:carboxypeptidase-like regulatory domain-containing protein [Pyrinomonadaceae bacterium]
MTVEKVFKGDAKTGADLTIAQGDAVLGCSWDFFAENVGESFLLYVGLPEKPSEPIYVSTCSRSTAVEGAKEDLLYLENIDKRRGHTRVSGVIDRDGDEDQTGQQVRIVGKNKTYIATTDKDGVYEIYDLPPGRYSLEPVLHSGWKIDEWRLTREWTRADWRRSELNLPPPTKVWFTLHPRKHFGASVDLRLANKIAGRVTTPAGQALNRVCVSLVPIEDSGSDVCRDFSNADGTFAIESVAAGSYRLLLNYENIRSSYQPFPKMYYPGVATAEAAKVFTVKFGESIEGLQFVVPTLYERVKFEGVVRYANGRPASGAQVTFTTPKTAEIDGDISATTDRRGRFSLTVLKGLRGELFSGYAPESYEFVNCSNLKKARAQTGKPYFSTPRLQVETTENKTFALKLPVSPCR